MDDYKSRTDLLREGTRSVSTTAAESVRLDFSELVSLFDRHLASVDHDNEVRSHLIEARTAAKRGLKLSQNLIGMMKARG